MDNQSKSKENQINPEFQEVWDLAKNYTLPESKTNDLAWENFKLKIEAQPKKESLLISYKRVFSVAASILLLAMAGAYFFLIAKPKTINENYTTQSKESKSINLPDGTKVFLNPNSKLVLSFSDAKRSLNLIGHARFEVKRNENAPFIVQTVHGTVTVLGTGFDVSSYNNSKFSVYVNHGKVKVETANEEAILTKGNYVSKTNSKLFLTQKTDNPVNLENNVITFNEATLQEVIQIISNVYSQKIAMPNSTSLKLNEKFTGKINYNQDLKEVCEVINAAMNTNLIVM